MKEKWTNILSIKEKKNKSKIYPGLVIYLAFMNLPRNMRFKRENIVIIGLIPGPSEPPKNINTYLAPLVSDLLRLWHGVEFSTYNAGTCVIRCALLNIACDLPAGRKACGFLSFSANLGCSGCYCNFGTSTFMRNIITQDLIEGHGIFVRIHSIEALYKLHYSALPTQSRKRKNLS